MVAKVGDHGRAEPVPELYQHVHDAVVLIRQQRVNTTTSLEAPFEPAKTLSWQAFSMPKRLYQRPLNERTWVQYLAAGNENVSSVKKKPMLIVAYVIFATTEGLQF